LLDATEKRPLPAETFKDLPVAETIELIPDEVKTRTDRYEKISEAIPLKGLHRLAVRDKTGSVSEGVFELKGKRLRILPSIAKSGKHI
jgi:hypothetical protein